MRFGTTLPARLAPYDRSSKVLVTSGFSSGLAPHANTQRYSYLVPAGKIFMFSSIYIEVLRITAAAPVGLVSCDCSISPSAGGIGFPAFVNTLDNLVGSTNRIAAGSNFYLQTSDLITGHDADLSTGGTVSYQNSFIGNEYNA